MKYKYKGEFNKVIAISKEDMAYIELLKKDYPKMSKAGILKFIINFYKTKNDKNKTK
jgi:hypothetical protein